MGGGSSCGGAFSVAGSVEAHQSEGDRRFLFVDVDSGACDMSEGFAQQKREILTIVAGLFCLAQLALVAR